MPVVALALVLATTSPAAAGGSADLSALASTLSSPSNAYGPWLTEDLSLRLPPDGGAGIEIVSRHTSDRFSPSTAQYFVLDDYHAWSKRFSTYVAAGAGTGAPFARTRFSLEGDLVTGRRIVAVAGLTVAQTYDAGALTQASIGLDYYFADDYLSLRYRPTWSATLGNTSGFASVLSLGRPGRSTHTLRLGGGGENDAASVGTVAPSIVGVRAFDASYTYKHWTGPASGFHLDLGYGTLTRRGGTRIYSHLDTGLGYFFALK